jgi:hypothetical protein
MKFIYNDHKRRHTTVFTTRLGLLENMKWNVNRPILCVYRIILTRSQDMTCSGSNTIIDVRIRKWILPRHIRKQHFNQIVYFYLLCDNYQNNTMYKPYCCNPLQIMSITTLRTELKYYIYIYIYIHTHTHIHTHIYTHTHAHTPTHTNITHVIYHILAGFKTLPKNPLNKA